MLKEPRLVVVANSVYLQENMHSLANTKTGNSYTLLDIIKYVPKFPYCEESMLYPRWQFEWDCHKRSREPSFLHLYGSFLRFLPLRFNLNKASLLEAH